MLVFSASGSSPEKSSIVTPKATTSRAFRNLSQAGNPSTHRRNRGSVVPERTASHSLSPNACARSHFNVETTYVNCWRNCTRFRTLYRRSRPSASGPDPEAVHDIMQDHGPFGPSTIHRHHTGEFDDPPTKRTVRTYLSKVARYNLLKPRGTRPGSGVLARRNGRVTHAMAPRHASSATVRNSPTRLSSKHTSRATPCVPYTEVQSKSGAFKIKIDIHHFRSTMHEINSPDNGVSSFGFP
jgi:hypothetical protein